MGRESDQAVEALLNPGRAERSTESDDAVNRLLTGNVDQNQVGAGDSVYTPRIPRGIAYEDLNLENKDAGFNDPHSASLLTLIKAAGVDDVPTKKRILAKALLGSEDAASRFEMIDDHPIYEKDGKLYTAAAGGIVNRLRSLIADMGGHAAPIAGGIIGGGAVGGPGGAILGAGAGAAGGSAIRSTLGGLVFGEPQSTPKVLGNMALEGAFGAGGSLIGAGVTKGLNRNLARDFSRYDANAAADIQSKARSFGIDLNAAQASNVPSIKGKFEALARMSGPNQDIIDEAMKRQAGQADRAARDFFKQVSPVEGQFEIGERGVSGAEKAISYLINQRTAEASPIYQRAFNAGVDFTPEKVPALKELMQRPGFQDAMKKAVILAKNDGLDATDPANSLLRAHYAKLALDDSIQKEAKYASGSTFQRGLIGIEAKLLAAMDRASPDYAQARDVFSAHSPGVEAIRSGILNQVAKLPADKVDQAARLMFRDSSSPLAVLNNRQAMVTAGALNDYNALLKSYLEQGWAASRREFKSGAGGAVGQAPSFRAMMMGDPAQQAVLRAAMDAKQWGAFQDLSAVFDAMGRVTGRGNSITMPATEAAAAVRREAGSSLPTKINTAVRAWDWPKALGNFLDQVKQGDHAEKLAEMIVNPQGNLKLRELSQLEPGTAKFLQKFAAAFGIKLAPTTQSDDQQ